MPIEIKSEPAPGRTVRPGLVSRKTQQSGAPLSPDRRKAVNQRQPIQAFAESFREIVHPALAGEPAPLTDFFHGQAENQNLMHQHRTVGAEFAARTVEPQHRPALVLGDRLARRRGIDIFPRRIDGSWAPLGLLPIVLKRSPAPELCLINLVVAEEPCERIVADRAQRDDLLARLERERVIHFDLGHLGVQRQILRLAVMNPGRSLRLVAFGPWHDGALLFENGNCRKSFSGPSGRLNPFVLPDRLQARR